MPSPGMEPIQARLAKARRVHQPSNRTLWQYTCEPLRVWVGEDGDGDDADIDSPPANQQPSVVRPFLMVLTEVYPRGSILRYKYAHPAGKPPSPDQVVQLILDQVLKPAGGAAQERPNVVTAVDDNMVASIQHQMKAIGVEATKLSKADGVDEFIKRFSERLISKDQAAVSESSNHPGLLSISGVAQEHVASLLEQGIAMVDRMPWEDSKESTVLKVQPNTGATFDKPLYLTVLGHSGKAFGWTATSSLRALVRKYRKATNAFDLDNDIDHDMLCGFCGSESAPGATVLQCSACKELYYCSEKCREADWVLRHHNECLKIKQGELDLIIRKFWERREWTFLVTEQTTVPFDDLDMAALHGWPKGSKPGLDSFVPFVSVTNPGFPPKMERPQAREIKWMEQIARALSQKFEAPRPGEVVSSTDALMITQAFQCAQ